MGKIRRPTRLSADADYTYFIISDGNKLHIFGAAILDDFRNYRKITAAMSFDYRVRGAVPVCIAVLVMC